MLILSQVFLFSAPSSEKFFFHYYKSQEKFLKCILENHNIKVQTKNKIPLAGWLS